MPAPDWLNHPFPLPSDGEDTEPMPPVDAFSGVNRIYIHPAHKTLRTEGDSIEEVAYLVHPADASEFARYQEIDNERQSGRWQATGDYHDRYGLVYERVAPQPGDNLPESPDTLPGDGVDPLGLFPEPPLPNFTAQERVVEQALALADAKTEIQLLRDLNKRKTDRINEFARSNQHQRDTIDALRRDLAEANARLAQQPPDGLAELRARVNELASIVLEPVPYEVVERRARVEVKTLRTSIRTPEKMAKADIDLADALNTGWEIRDIAIDSGSYGSDDWCIRIVTLTREIEDDATSPDPQADALEPAADPVIDDTATENAQPIITDVNPVRPSLNKLPALAQRIRTDGLDATKATLNADLFAVGQAAYEARSTSNHLSQRPPMLPGLPLPVIGGAL